VVANAKAIRPSGDSSVLAVEGDLADPPTADQIIGGALERFGRIDTLVNNAGVFISKPSPTTTTSWSGSTSPGSSG
jgi:NAD(P)-dependent dehydrogenase (short-subunit alcohol dehydrogenase family)